ncbi:prephenate dehydratase [Stackebrandtia albiflava]|uniref:Prephenate dehydratase n=1 Tax=Stackebrandtia albiflava TaxID=406432 RepID=A0A562ULN7_9ACTN|nr:prephenate dehydratase [Stackebrandtia albiflava]TWJ06528.1 prephenate dehydratase [Stackebrandtia albiflava]
MPGVPPSRFAYLGPAGTFTEAALLRLPAAARGTRVPVRSVPEALDAVRAGDVDAALVPLENSVEGSVPVTLDALVAGDPLIITAEVVLPVTFVLAAAGAGPIHRIASHPHALAQTRRYLRDHHPDATTVEVLSTAAAAASVAAGEADACVCAPLAAAHNGLRVLAEDVGDNPEAATRFALVSRPGPAAPPSGNDVTSLVVYIAHDEVGALLSVLTELATRGVNLTRIESRPTGERLGRYAFYLDCTGHVAEAPMGEALMGLRRVCAEVRFLGSYPRDTDEPPVPPPPALGSRAFADAAGWLRALRGTT